jgi:indole-3-glycerol phosphate synthase
MNILQEIVKNKRAELSSLPRDNYAEELRSSSMMQRAGLSLKASLASTLSPFSIIAEFKRRSPSKPQSSLHNLEDVVKSYERNGAAALSVLTDEKYFDGSLHDLRLARKFSTLPILRKDFVVDPIQILEAKAYGADAVLLIAAVLSKSELHDFADRAHDLGLECLVELHDESEIDKIPEGADLLGVNHRNLKTMEIDLDMSRRLAAGLSGQDFIGESGIRNSDDLRMLQSFGCKGYLIGSSLMKEESPGDALRQLMGVSKRQRA